MANIVVIGSGPAGIATSSALLRNGHRVKMLDVGNRLDAETSSRLKNYKATRDVDILPSFRSNLEELDHIKLAYGSDYVYRNVDKHLILDCDQSTFCQPTFACGGLTNVWGAVVDEYRSADFSNWPFTQSELRPFYRYVFELLPKAVASNSDADRIHERKNYFHQSGQATALLEKMTESERVLEFNKIRFGSTSLAADFVGGGEQLCTYCGMCHHGCPLSLIYSANHTVSELARNDEFTYIDNIYVRSVSENQREIRVNAVDLSNDQAKEFIGDYVFIAAGAISTTKILLSSLRLFDQKVTLIDSQSFVVPGLNNKFKSYDYEMGHHTLAQIFLEVGLDGATGPAYLQLYSYMDYYAEKVHSLTGIPALFLEKYCRTFLNQMLGVVGFLHSSDSANTTIALCRDDRTLRLRRGTDGNYDRIMSELDETLRRNRRQLGFRIFPWLRKKYRTNRGYHYGGTFPMRNNPGRLETDVMGRPSGFNRVHAVDGTIFPDIAARSFTPTIMANAYRIASMFDHQ